MSKKEKKVATCRLCDITDVTGGLDLHPSLHEGFTIGNGKTMYWYIVWTKNGNATVYKPEANPNGRFVEGNTIITIHYKQSA